MPRLISGIAFSGYCEIFPFQTVKQYELIAAEYGQCIIIQLSFLLLTTL